MPFVKQPLADGKEDQPVNEGQYDLRVHSFAEEISKKGNPMWHAMITIEGESAPPVHDYFSMVQDGDSEDAIRLKMRGLNRFLDAFSVAREADGFDTDDVPGATASLFLTKEPFSRDDPKSDEVNRVRYPRLDD